MTMSTQIGRPLVTCIVPAFNEAPRIGAVLRVLTVHPMIGRVIVIDDGSTDDTAAIAERFTRVDLIRLWPNGGKTLALAAGFARTEGPYVMLIDSDLTGLDHADLSDLILPVLENRADISISLRGKTSPLWRLIGIDYISGERMLRRDLIAGRLDELSDLPRFGFEVWLNRICVARTARIAIVPWARVDSTAKNLKFGFAPGVLADLRMIADLFRCESPLRLINQIRAMRRLRVVGSRPRIRARKPGGRLTSN